ncbi:CHAD domain-containing protein [Steroidobacter sp.]|uniref:CHAD domain-containing protein n=1 Tax=Steroidobacter sp. TaxID=1978227 RepID=UPI001A63024D|nr:CHAD domain-containing protein [Steroidobacter sp.]MBL8266824.1 CHAD domain-containing protein [Steroidobacter sp.]
MCSDQVGQVGLSDVRRILQAWLAAAGDSLRKKRIVDADIHDARKLIKKSRAALRLLRAGVGEVSYCRENGALRDAAQPLGLARDSKVLIAALDALLERFAPAAHSLQLDKFRSVLRKERVTARQAITLALVREQIKTLREVSARGERWRLRGESWSVLGGGLEKIYRSGKKKMRAAARSRDDAQLHDWRKQVKYLWYQLQILASVQPAPIEAWVEQACRLADLLGDDHDLAVLRAKIAANAAVFKAYDQDALIAILDRRRNQLQAKALKLGARLYEEKPRRFVARVAKHWRQRHAE